jgi:hypothetical protein
VSSLADVESDEAGSPAERSGPAGPFVEIYVITMRRYAPDGRGGERLVERRDHYRWWPFAPDRVESGPSVDGVTRVEYVGNEAPAHVLWALKGEWIRSGRRTFLRTLTHKALDVKDALCHARTGSPSIGFERPGPRPAPAVAGPVVAQIPAAEAVADSPRQSGGPTAHGAGQSAQLGFGWAEEPARPSRPRRKGRETSGDVPGWKVATA